MYQRLNNAGIILAWQLCRVDFWNKQKYLSLYDSQTSGLIVKQYFPSFSFPLRPCRKNCCIFVNRNGREMLTLEAEGIHRHRRGAGACIMCRGSSFCASSLLTLKWKIDSGSGKGAVELQVEKGLVLKPGVELLPVFNAEPATSQIQVWGIPFGNVLFRTFPSAPAP